MMHENIDRTIRKWMLIGKNVIKKEIYLKNFRHLEIFKKLRDQGGDDWWIILYIVQLCWCNKISWKDNYNDGAVNLRELKRVLIIVTR